MRKITALLLTSVLSAVAVAQAPSNETDLDLITRVKTTLAANAETRPLPLMISISDGVVNIGGPVPSMKLQERIQAIVRDVPGMTTLRVNCWVPANEDPLAAAVKAKLKTTSTTAPIPETPPAPKPVVPDLAMTAPLPVLGPAQTTQAARDTVRGDTFSPVPPPAPPAPQGPPDGETIPPPRVPVKPAQDVVTAVEAVQSRDRRYAKLTITARLGVVTITGTDADAAWDLAAEIRRVPGVERVIVARPVR